MDSRQLNMIAQYLSGSAFSMLKLQYARRMHGQCIYIRMLMDRHLMFKTNSAPKSKVSWSPRLTGQQYLESQKLQIQLWFTLYSANPH